MCFFRIAFLPFFRIAFLDKHPIQFCHLLDIQVVILPCVADRYCYEFLFLDIRKWIFLVGKIAS